jgi:hypothetical protein
MCVLGARLTLGPMHTLSNFSSPHSLSPDLAIFHPRTLSRPFVTLETIALPPPPAILDPGLGGRRRLIPGPRAHHHRHLPQVICVPLLVIVTSPPLTSTPPPSEHTATIDLDPTSLGVCHCHLLPQALDTASGEGDTPPLPHYRCCLVRFERYLLPM